MNAPMKRTMAINPAAPIALASVIHTSTDNDDQHCSNDQSDDQQCVVVGDHFFFRLSLVLVALIFALRALPPIELISDRSCADNTSALFFPPLTPPTFPIADAAADKDLSTFFLSFLSLIVSFACSY